MSVLLPALGTARPAPRRQQRCRAGRRLGANLFVGLSLEVTNTNDSGPGSLRQALVNANILGGTPTVTFAMPGAGPHVIALASNLPDLNQCVQFELDQSEAVEVGTSNASTFGNYPGLVKLGAGTLTIAGTPSHAATSTLAVIGGTLRLGAIERFASITIAAGGTLALVANSNYVLAAQQLALDPAAILDLGDNDLILQATPATRNAVYDQLNAWLASGFATFAWNGPGIHRSAAAGDTSFRMALAIILNDDGLGGAFYNSFDGQPVDANSVLVKYTRYGDADLSGLVDGTDYAPAENGFNARLTGWFNY